MKLKEEKAYNKSLIKTTDFKFAGTDKNNFLAIPMITHHTKGVPSKFRIGLWSTLGGI